MKFAPGAWKYAIVPLLAAPFALLISVTASLVALAAGAGTLAFFRDPERSPPPTGVVSPADGNVSVLREEGDRVRLGVFMNVWHVHVVRSPSRAGSPTSNTSPVRTARPSRRSPTETSASHVRLETDSPNLPSDAGTNGAAAIADDGGEPIGDEPEESASDDPNAHPDELDHDADVTLIAGAFARRIHPYAERGDDLERGERIGHIAFGSRVDLLFPPTVDLEDVAVDIGDSMTAGESVVLESSAGTLAGEFDLET